MSLTGGRSALLGNLLRQHGEEPAPEIAGPIVPDNNLTSARVSHSPFDLVSFLESQRDHPPSLDTCVRLSDNQGHLSVRGLKSTKMAFGKLVKDKTWRGVDSSSTESLGAAFFSNLCKATSGCLLVRSGESEGTQAVNTTAHRVFFRETTPGRHRILYMFLAWRMKFDGILFSGGRRALGFFYVYVRDTRCPRFNTDGYLPAWLPDDMSTFSCSRALDAYTALTGRDLLSTATSTNPVPIPPNVASICREQRPPASVDTFWDTVLVPMHHSASDALKSCTVSSNAALIAAAEFILLEFYPQLARSAKLALVIAWGTHDLQGGTSQYLAAGSALFTSAVAYLGPNDNNPSLVPYLFVGAPPAFVKFVWNATPDFAKLHRAFLTVVVREAHIDKLVEALSDDDRWTARLRAIVEIGSVVAAELRALLASSKHTAKLGPRWRAILPFVAGKGVRNVARVLATTPRLRINQQVLSNLIAYVERQVSGLAPLLPADSSFDSRPDLAVGIVWMHTQAAVALAHDTIREAGIEDADAVLSHYRVLFADAPSLAREQAREDARITAEHLLAVARATRQREGDARKRKREIADGIDGVLNELRDSGDTGGAVRALKMLRKRARE